jgi:crotonobetainyl-CoA:carnitine CoA-transferase CaiB-like acyl-CoA transferase
MIVHGIGGRHVAMQTVGAPQLWARLVAMMDRPDLASDARFATPAGRREHWAELHPIICKWLDRFKTVEEAVKTLTAARVPASAVLSPAEVVAHPHLAERQAFPAIEHPGRGTVRITAVPFHVDSRPVKPRGGAPYRVGEHTRAVLGDVLGYSRERIDELLRLGTVAAV